MFKDSKAANRALTSIMTPQSEGITQVKSLSPKKTLPDSKVFPRWVMGAGSESVGGVARPSCWRS